MERQQFHAVWLCLFAIAGSCARLCQAAPTDLKQSSKGVSELGLETTEDFFLKVDEQERPQGMFKSRVVRYVPRSDTDQGSTAEWIAEQQRIAQNERDRRQREQRQQARALEVQQRTSSELAQEERDRQRGNVELWDRYDNAQNKKRIQPSKKIVQPSKKIVQPSKKIVQPSKKV